MIFNQRRMAWWIKDSGCVASLAAMVIILCMLVTMSSAVKALTGHVGIVNDFRSPTEFTCHSNRVSRQSYTASFGEIYYFAFDTSYHEYWDCQVYNRAWTVRDTFRFYGDQTHGGPELWSCSNCVFSVQEVGIYFSHDGKWMYIHHWH
jgi:hypothetical protein